MATIQKRGSSYRVQIRRKGLPALIRSFDTRKEADTWARKLEGRIAADEFVDTSEAKQTTLSEALRRYLREVTPSKRGRVQETNRIKAWLRDPLASRSLASIRSSDIAEWRTARMAEGKAPTTIKNALQIISQVYVIASTEWEIEGLRNPVRGVRMPQARPGRERRLEGDEEERLLAACDACGSPWLRPLVMLAIETAMRQGELLSLTRATIKGSMAYLPTTKNGKPRSVPLSTRALAVLAGLPATLKGPVFPIPVDSLEYYWRKACRIAGIEDLHFHDLRHEAVSRLFEKGLSAEEVMQVSGHRTYAMLARYTHLRSATLLEKLG